MSKVYSFVCGLPICQNSQQGKQTNLSISLRVGIVALGLITAIAGVLILLNVSGLSQLGTTVGWAAFSIGVFLTLIGASIKCVKKQSNDNIKESQFTGKLSAEQKQILTDFTPQMIEALGGIDKVMRFPTIGNNWDGDIIIDHLKAPIMKGYHGDGRPFLLFCYLRYSEDEGGYEITGEYLGRRNRDGWEGSFLHTNEFNLRSPNPILDNTLEAAYMLEKINRLISREAIGAVEKFPGIYLNKPSDKASWHPNNAYLDDEKLDAFMDLDTLFYERRPVPGMTELFLYDPSISQEENKKLLHQKFPGLPIGLQIWVSRALSPTPRKES